MPEATNPTPDALFQIANRSIVIAGAASGLGRAMARALAARGARLMLADIAAGPLAELARELGPDVAMHIADITKETDAEAIMAQTRESFGGVDGLVNTVGLLRVAPALSLTTTCFKETLEVNVTGAFILSRAAARAMQDKGGRIVHFASVSSIVANVNYAAYATSKAALSQLVRVLAREWSVSRITVNAIGPAMTATEMTDGYLSDATFRNQALQSIPLGRLGTPEDLVGTLLLLLSPAGAFITGQTIYVDGGRTLV
jgi:NAD(P)-dependent dehydrogenase (short-subunit alcohol dehydrogenase family)